jgi:hypothetical protein
MEHIPSPDAFVLLEAKTEELKAKGWSVSKMPFSWIKLSMTLAPFKCIRLSQGLSSSFNRACVLYHEAVHAERADAYGRWKFSLRYLWSFAFRREEEIEAEIEETLIRLQLLGNKPESAEEVIPFVSSSVWGWQYPYFIGGSKQKLYKDIAKRVFNKLTAPQKSAGQEPI